MIDWVLYFLFLCRFVGVTVDILGLILVIYYLNKHSIGIQLNCLIESSWSFTYMVLSCTAQKCVVGIAIFVRIFGQQCSNAHSRVFLKRGHEFHNLTRFLQLGHWSFSFNQLLMQLVWNTWQHIRAFTWAPDFKRSKHIEQITSFSLRFISAFCLSVWLSFIVAPLPPLESCFWSLSSLFGSSNLYDGIAFIMSRIYSGDGNGSPSESTFSSSSSSW